MEPKLSRDVLSSRSLRFERFGKPSVSKRPGYTPDGIIYSVAVNATEAGMEYAPMTRALSRKGYIDPKDPRVEAAENAQKSLLWSNASSFGAQANYWTSRLESGLPKTEEGRSISLLQRKLAGRVMKSGSFDDPAVAMLSHSLEDAALKLPPSLLQRRILRLAAQGVDASVLSIRHRDFDGLVTDVSDKARLSVDAVTPGLVRSSLIAQDDPRAIPRLRDAGGLDQLDTQAFMTEIGGRLRRGLSTAGEARNPRFSKKAVLADIQRVPRAPERGGETQAEATRRYGRIMRLSARACERLAMNLWERGGRSDIAAESAAPLVSAAISASRRATVYSVRERKLDREAAHRKDPGRNLEI